MLSFFQALDSRQTEICGLAFFLLRAIRQRGDCSSLPIGGYSIWPQATWQGISWR